jgi:hypothetical protein
VFTFGPYSNLYTQAYHPATYGLALVSGVLLGLGYAALLLMTLKRHNLPWLMAYVGFLLLIDSRDTLFFSYPLLVVLVAYQANLPGTDPGHLDIAGSRCRRLVLPMCIALLGVLPIIKGSFLPMAVAAVLACMLMFWRKPIRSYALLLACLPLVTMALAWRVAGQPVTALPDYFWSMVPVISGYTDAMATYPHGRNWPLLRFALPSMFLAYLGVSALALVATWRNCRTKGLNAAVLIGCLALFLFVAFKAGFVRQDQHVLAAGSALLLAVLALRLFDVGRPGVWIGGVALATWMLIHFIYMPNTLEGSPIYNIYSALSGERWGNKLPEVFARRLQNIRGQYPVAKLQGSTDIYPYDLAALIASNNHWVPRPMLQSYSAYTPTLAKLNEAHLRGGRAPDNVVLRSTNIDKRFPSMEDGLSWPTLFSHYTVTGRDLNYIYLKKQPEPTEWRRQIVQQGQHQTGDTFEVPHTSSLLFAEIDIRHSLLGRIANIVYKTSALDITVDLQSGQSRSYRLVPGMARAGFILSPLVQSNADWIQLARGQMQALDQSVVTRVRITPTEGGTAFWQPQYTLRLTSLTPEHELRTAMARSRAQPSTALAQQGME